MREITIASEERYSDWSAAVKAELIRRGLDVGEAYDLYSFLEAYEQFGSDPVQAVDDYQKWVTI